MLAAAGQCLPCSAQVPAPATGIESAAGTTIINVASVESQYNGTVIRVESNVSRLPVVEILDVHLTTPVTSVPVGNDRVTSVPFTIVNDGNGSEAFVLDPTSAEAGAGAIGIALDQNRNGRYDPAIDLDIASGTAIPPLGAGASAQMLALLSADRVNAAGTVTVGVHAVTGFGEAGTTFAGQGDGGVDAVVGATNADASLELPLNNASPLTGQVSVFKSQSVVARNGSDTPSAGAVVTYEIAANFGGTTTASAARIVDAVPAGTTYVAGSLRLDGVVLTDSADADSGSFDGDSVAVLLGDVPAPATRTVQFDVTIQ